MKNRAAEGVGPYGNAEFGIWNEEEAENPRVSQGRSRPQETIPQSPPLAVTAPPFRQGANKGRAAEGVGPYGENRNAE